jgi:hypothetical protein
MATRAAKPQRGDALILGTAKSFEVYAVGRAVRDGQQDLQGVAEVKYFECASRAKQWRKSSSHQDGEFTFETSTRANGRKFSRRGFGV